ncbi:CBO2463/CBO2479 domain-containing protein [Metaclostridioides mangenotii]|uniref:CBO2463/CBO2479 domain-containing protein n=1 Tax=Metaclostridioides mangenotii TaxID=1540 RepID=UPI0004640922|nr:CBO2463/CBO2479 domain-containing protein [Clostridioides mangenotii]
MDIQIKPKLLPGRIIDVTDIGVKIELNGRMGIIILPLRSVFTEKKLTVGDEIEIYLSYAKVIK